MTKAGILVDDIDALYGDQAQWAQFTAALSTNAPHTDTLILSQKKTGLSALALRDHLPNSYLGDSAILSRKRLAGLVDGLWHYDNGRLDSLPVHKKPVYDSPRFGFVVSNGYGLGHVSRMRAFAQGLKQYGDCAFLSLSAVLVRDALSYAPSAQYLDLSGHNAHDYTRSLVLDFIRTYRPTHIFYDGNVLPDGLLAALSGYTDIYLVWVRRGMWHPLTHPAYLAPQALADLVIEPGDLAGGEDTGPTRTQSHTFCAPSAYLETKPVRYTQDSLAREDALRELGVDAVKTALIMTGSAQNNADHILTRYLANCLIMAGYHPVIAHWPMSGQAPDDIPDATIIERTDLARYYNAFDLIVSAAGYNAYHEILSTSVPCIFMPQEDEGRDDQLARARYAERQGWAALCRRDDIHKFSHALVSLKEQTRPDLEWHADWNAITRNLGIGHTKRQGEIISAAPDSISMRMVRRLAKIIHRRHGDKNERGGTERPIFILAINISVDEFRCRYRPDPRCILITNSIDPVCLRRMRVRYLWLNSGSKKRIMRQFLVWIHIWQPERIISL